MLAILVAAFIGAIPAPSANPSPSPSPSPSPTPATPYAALKWREVGPAAAGGRVPAVAGSATNPKLYFIGAADGGVWRTSNGGVTWDPVFDDQAVQSIGAVTLAPSDDKVVWVGTGEANPRNDVVLGDGIYKSTDGGDSWKKMGLGGVRSIARIVVDPKNADHVVAGGIGDFFKDSPAGGVYVTYDGGKTWTHSLYVGPSSGASDLAMDPKDPDVVYAGIWQFRREPWTASSGGPDDGLYKSTDGGKTFAKLAGRGLPGGPMGRIAVDVSRSDHTRVYALIQSKAGFLYRSDDSGASWTMVNSGTLADQRPFYFSHIAVDPTDKNRIFSVSFFPAVSKDGGKTFKNIATDIHPDYHAIWIAPDDPKRMILGNDGGAVITVDGGKRWFFSRNYAIAQIYHVAADDANPYDVCGGMQDNMGWCWPSNSLDTDGITNAYAVNTIGGDGEWVVPDPAHPGQIWGDSEDGSIALARPAMRDYFNVPPDFGGFHGFDYSRDPYRFDWDSPIAFDPWDPHTMWFGGDVVFQTRDEGRHWSIISPDLTLDDKSRQVIPGGPITRDVSGAETFDTILDIEGSPRARGEIWVGTNDGLVRLTRDGGKHWANVTPRGIPPYGRVEVVAPSTLVDGTAFVCFDRHYSGDETPYVFRTTDFGKTWTSIASGLPKDQPVRAVRPDVVNSRVVFAGLERSIWVSFDGGASWKSLQANLPHVAVFDIRLQPRFDDLIIATHGRGAWIMDDIRPLQELDRARGAGHYVFQPRAAYEYSMTERAEGIFTEYAAPNPPTGTIIDFYQAKAGAKPPVIDIFDGHGHRLRHVVGSRTDPGSGKRTPFVKNDVWLNRYVWDFGSDPITPWYGAANKSAREPSFGWTEDPGDYSARVTFSDGTVVNRRFTVLPDPKSPWTQADRAKRSAFGLEWIGYIDRIDRALNSIDRQIARLKKIGTPAAVHAIAAGAALKTRLSANYENEDDGIAWGPGLLEDVQSVFSAGTGNGGPPLDPAFRAAAIVKPRFDRAMSSVSSWLAAAKSIR